MKASAIFLLCLLALPVFAGSHTFYFAWSAVDSFGLESDWSVVRTWEREAGGAQVVTARCEDPDMEVTLWLHWWMDAGGTNCVDAGTNRTMTVRIVPAALTNIVITVTGAANSWCITNPVASSCFVTGQNLTITERRF